MGFEYGPIHVTMLATERDSGTMHPQRERDHYNNDTEVLCDSGTRLVLRVGGPESAIDHDSGTYLAPDEERSNCRDLCWSFGTKTPYNCTEICVGSEAGLYLRLTELFLGSREMKKKREKQQIAVGEGTGDAGWCLHHALVSGSGLMVQGQPSSRPAAE